jgi:tetratricopeptide (TPR) repeat protein
MNRCTFVCVLSLQLVAATHRASASPAVEQSPDVEIAQRRFESGRAFYERREYPQALAEFEAARRAQPLPALHFNVARCYDRMDQPAAAIREYERYLATAPPPADRAEVQKRIRELQLRVAPAPSGSPANELVRASTPLTARPIAPPPAARRSRTRLAVALTVSLTAATVLALGLGFGLSSPSLTPSPFPVIRGTP